MNSVLVITPCSPQGLPTQGLLIAERLRQTGVRTCILSKAKHGWGRFFEVAFYGFILARQYDVMLVNVFGHRAFVYESIAIFYARLWKKRVVAIIRNGWMPDFVAKWPRLNRLVLSQPNLILVPHQFLKSRLSDLGLRIDGIIPNFIELEKYTFRCRSIVAPRFLYLRGMHWDYNPQMAISAFAVVQAKYPDALLTMTGLEGEESVPCRTLVRDLKLRNVHFLGLVPKDQIPTLADKHDIHLHTNRVENMPVTVIEMWACGIPIVGTAVGGMPYLVRNGVDGILIKSEDYQGMAEACLKILGSSDLARKLSCNGRRRAENLTWENIKQLWEEALLLKPETLTNVLSLEGNLSTYRKVDL
jgi:glycosyltransferase involved in cell wall biosynthesis